MKLLQHFMKLLQDLMKLLQDLDIYREILWLFNFLSGPNVLS